MLVPASQGCQPAGQFPPPYQAVLRIDDLADGAKPALREHARLSTRFREGVGANHSNPFVAERKVDQRPGRFRGIASGLMFGRDPIGNLHCAVGARRPLEPAPTDDRAGSPMNDAEAERPRIGFRGGVGTCEPIRRDVRPFVGLHARDLRANFSRTVGDELETPCVDSHLAKQ